MGAPYLRVPTKKGAVARPFWFIPVHTSVQFQTSDFYMAESALRVAGLES